MLDEKEYNPLDSLFKESFENYKETPSPYVWDNIASQLDNNKKQKQSLYFWKIAAAASFIGVILLSSYLFISNRQINDFANNSFSQNNTSIEYEFPTIENSTHKNINSNIKNDQNFIVSKSKSKKNQVSKRHDNQTLALLKPKAIETISQSNKITTSQLALSIKPNKRKYQPLPTVNKESSNNQSNRSSWAIGGSVSPNYNYRKSNSSTNNNEKGIVTIAGGININVKPQKKWAFSSGIHYSKIGQEIRSNTSASNFLASTPNNSSTQISLESSYGTINTSSDRLNAPPPITTTPEYIGEERGDIIAPEKITSNNNLTTDAIIPNSSSIKQEFEYLELPLLVKYLLIDKGVQISLNGGFSTMLLVGNNVTLITNESDTHFGSTNNIKNINYSSLLGISLSVPITKALNISIDPVFKHFMTPINTTSSNETTPYSYGVYTGITYRFR